MWKIGILFFVSLGFAAEPKLFSETSLNEKQVTIRGLYEFEIMAKGALATSEKVARESLAKEKARIDEALGTQFGEEAEWGADNLFAVDKVSYSKRRVQELKRVVIGTQYFNYGIAPLNIYGDRWVWVEKNDRHSTPARWQFTSTGKVTVFLKEPTAIYRQTIEGESVSLKKDIFSGWESAYASYVKKVADTESKFRDVLKESFVFFALQGKVKVDRDDEDVERLFPRAQYKAEALIFYLMP